MGLQLFTQFGIYPSGQPEPVTPALSLDTFLMVDESLLDSKTSNVQFIVGRATTPQTAFTLEDTWETNNNFVPRWPGTVLQDHQGNYKWYYSAHSNLGPVTGVAESTDGVNWTKPNLNLPNNPINNSNSNLIEVFHDGNWLSGDIEMHAVVYDGTEYKGTLIEIAGEDKKDIFIATSSDGYSWTTEGPLIADDDVDTQLGLLYDPSSSDPWKIYGRERPGGVPAGGPPDSYLDNRSPRLFISQNYNSGWKHRHETSSTDSLTIGSGTKNLTVGTNVGFEVGERVFVGNSFTDYMSGYITSYNSGTGDLTVDVDRPVGSGTFNNWEVYEDTFAYSPEIWGYDKVDFGDPPLIKPDIYSFGVTKYEDQYIGIFPIFLRDDDRVAAEDGARTVGPVYPTLAYSRDSINWAFPTRNNPETEYDPIITLDSYERISEFPEATNKTTAEVGQIYPATQVLTIGNTHYFYYKVRDDSHYEGWDGGSLRGSSERTQLFDYQSLELDQFGRYRNLDSNEGSFTSVLHYIRPGSTDLQLNINTTGSIEFELLNENDSVINGFERVNSTPVTGQGYHSLSWTNGKSISDIDGTNVKLKLYWDDGSIYSWRYS